MFQVRISTLVQVVAFAAMLLLLVLLREALIAAHIDETILRVASDASIYYEFYQSVHADTDLLESPALFLIGSPMLFMKLAGGNLIIVQLFNLALMFYALRTALACLATRSAQLLFIVGALSFPYFLFGFLGLNKEVYGMCSAIFFGSYLIRGLRRHLLLALVLAACARYYMLIALALLWFTVPLGRPPRYWAVMASLLALSIVAPVAKFIIPEYSAESVLEDSGRIGIVFAWAIDHFGYALVYPIKYVFLMPTRFYGFLIGATEDAMGAAVSCMSILMFGLACLALLKRRSLDPLVSRLIVAGLIAPVPIMWSEIMHWRYYSFVYFFFLYAVLLQAERRMASTSSAEPPHPAAVSSATA